MIEIRELTKSFRKVHAVRSLTMTVEKGDVCGFIGPNGAGKTTTIKMLATLLRPTRGTATIGGFDISRDRWEVKKLVGYMPDFFGVYDNMRVLEYLDFFGAAFRIPRSQRRGMIDDVMALTDLTAKANDFVGSLSRGMKQRLCLAKTLIHDPEVLLLDEPASGLDPRARIELRELIKELQQMGKTILISSHILGELADLCNKVAIIERGRLLAAGDVKEIFASLRREQIIEIDVLEKAEEAERFLRKRPGVERVDRIGNRLQVATALTSEEMCALHKALLECDLPVLWFRERPPDLEELFLSVTKGEVS